MQPEQLGPFRIGRVLGRGGMGAVYEGVHEQTGEIAAVKVLLSTLQEDDELRLRFEAEIDTLKRLRHPNIVRLFGFGEEQGMLYYVMEMVDGPSLHQEIKQQRLFQWHEVAKIGLEMCFAFKHAHDRGITHRDIKPANILLERQGTIKLSDFGIAHFFGGQRLTEVHSVVGTLEFMSPEQALANPVNARSDLYSLGAVLYALLVGRPPFTARNLPEILRKHQKGIIESIRSTRLDVPDELEIIIFDLLKIKPEDRPHHAYLVAKRFQSLLQALVGPPERILVKPMELDSPMAFPMGAVHIPYKGEQEQDKKIGHARGVIIDNGIIDLGGFVNDKQTDIINSLQQSPAEDSSVAPTISLENIKQNDTLPPETTPPVLPDSNATSLVDSFGQPGTAAKENRTLTLERLTPLSAVSDQSVTQSFTLSGSSDQPDVSDKLSDKPSVSTELSPTDSQQPSWNVLAETNKTQEDQNKPEKKNIETAFSENFPYHSPIQHGEVVLENIYGIRRAKDEPLPDINVFDALQQNRHAHTEPEEQPTIEIDLSAFGHSNETNNLTHNKPTVDGLTTGHLPGLHVPSDHHTPSNHIPLNHVNHVALNRSEVLGNIAEKPSDQKKNVEPYGLQNSEITAVSSKERSSIITDHSASSSHFTAVKDEEFDSFGDSATKHRPIISLQTVFASCCLILIGITAYYLLQPVSADTLYERIKQMINENSDNEGISSSALRSAEGDINHFLLEHSQHPMADQVRFYQTELDLVKQEQILKRRQRLANSEIPSPIEQVYMEATALIKTNPESAIIKLKAIVDVFHSDNFDNFNNSFPKTSEKQGISSSQSVFSEPAKITRRQRPNPTELCVELATRRLEKLEKEIETINSDQFKVIRKRLDDANELEQKSPQQAKKIRQGIIELYQHHHWAKPLVEEAQQKLQNR
ncbi:MAG: serine/threonine protein kinase [Planctomycetaceae bacterium]|jgi:serine/threonine protein kinase|nr:serine/threonine protein kinase [Planctomycetaceae bacterium]